MVATIGETFALTLYSYIDTSGSSGSAHDNVASMYVYI